MPTLHFPVLESQAWVFRAQTCFPEVLGVLEANVGLLQQCSGDMSVSVHQPYSTLEGIENMGLETLNSSLKRIIVYSVKFAGCWEVSETAAGPSTFSTPCCLGP